MEIVFLKVKMQKISITRLNLGRSDHCVEGISRFLKKERKKNRKNLFLKFFELLLDHQTLYGISRENTFEIY